MNTLIVIGGCSTMLGPSHGSLVGTVTNQLTGDGVEGVTIRVGGAQARTNGEGTWTVPDIVPGSVVVEADADGFTKPEAVTTSIEPGAAATVTFSVFPVPPNQGVYAVDGKELVGLKPISKDWVREAMVKPKIPIDAVEGTREWPADLVLVVYDPEPAVHQDTSLLELQRKRLCTPGFGCTEYRYMRGSKQVSPFEFTRVSDSISMLKGHVPSGTWTFGTTNKHWLIRVP